MERKKAGRSTGDIEYFSFINSADQHFEHTATIIPRACGQVDFMFPCSIGRMEASEIRRLAALLIEAATVAEDANNLIAETFIPVTQRVKSR